MERYAQPTSVKEAVELLATDGWVMLAGGTDFYPGLGERPVSESVLDISRIDALDGISRDDDRAGWRIGALATWTQLVRADCLPPSFDCLKQAALEVGSVQIQNRATIVGNICNASPAADGVPALLVMEAEVELASAQTTRRLGLSKFLQGNRQTARQPDEIVTGIFIPDSGAQGSSAFFKLGARRYLVISIAMVAARLELDDTGLVKTAAVSVGACSVVAQRLRDLENDLVGARSAQVQSVPEARHLECLSPIDDVRAPAGYRLEAALEGVRRALAACVEAPS
ncbi:MAG: FAD binding domain-containing protein [Anderseniella sp.]